MNAPAIRGAARGGERVMREHRDDVTLDWSIEEALARDIDDSPGLLPRHFEMQRGLDTVLGDVREALRAAHVRAAAAPQSTTRESR